MAVTGTYLDVLTHLLKTRYIDRVNWAMKRKHVWLAHVKRQKRALSGTTFTHPVMTAETQGVGPGAHTSDLPTPGYTAGINPTWSPRPHRGRILVYAAAMFATKDNLGSYLRAWALETDSLVRSFMVDVNNETLGDGTGSLGYIESAQDSTSVTLTCNQGARNNHLVQAGMYVDMIDADDNSTKVLSNARVTARTATTVTLSSAPSGSASGDYFVRAGGNVSGTGYFFDGLHCIVNEADPTLADHGGLDRDTAANDHWKGHQHNFNSSFTLDDVDEAYDKVLDNSDEVPDFAITRRSTQRLMGRTLFDKIRYTPQDTANMDPWPKVMYGKVPVYADTGVWSGELYFLTKSAFEFMQVNEPSWMDFDGAVPHRVTNKEAYEATFTWHAAFACHKPWACVRAYGIADPR